MNTKTSIKTMLALFSFAAFSGSVFAAVTPTVTFQGEITDQTCSVSINGETNPIVLLPTVAVADFGSLANGQTAGLTSFTVSLSGCTAPAAGAGPLPIKTRFLGYDVDSASGTLGNRATTDAAVGYGIQLTTTAAGTTPIVLSGITDVAGLSLAEGDTSTSHTFGAQYYIVDAPSATPGVITGVAEYSLSYF